MWANLNRAKEIKQWLLELLFREGFVSSGLFSEVYAPPEFLFTLILGVAIGLAFLSFVRRALEGSREFPAFFKILAKTSSVYRFHSSLILPPWFQSS